MGKDEEGFLFAKLKGPENFEQWSNNMRGALLASDLWVFIDNPSSRPEPPELKVRDDDDEDRTERIYERAERRAKFFGYRNSCIGKIYRQYTFNIQQILDSDPLHLGGVTSSAAKWTPKELWDSITVHCTEKGWGVKWGLINRLGDTILRGDSEQDANALLSRYLDLQQKIVSHNMTVNELLSIMVLNQLPAQYDTLKQIKRNDAKNASQVPSIQEIVEAVKDDMKNRHQNHNVVNFARQYGKGGGAAKGRTKDGKDIPQCTFPSCRMLGHTIDNCTKKFPERRDEILKAAREAREKRQKKKEDKDKDKDKDKGKEKEDDKEEKKKGAWDVQMVTAVSTPKVSTKSSKPVPTDEEILGLKQMIQELQTLINNKAAKNATKVLRTYKVGSVWHTIIDSGA